MNMNIYCDDPGGKTRFDPVNKGSRGAAFHHEGCFLAQGGDLYTSVNASSNLRFIISPLQYFVKCLFMESSLPVSLPPHARHIARFPVIPMCLLHSHFPRKALLHTLQHHFPRMWLNMGMALRQLGSGVGDSLGDTW